MPPAEGSPLPHYPGRPTRRALSSPEPSPGLHTPKPREEPSRLLSRSWSGLGGRPATSTKAGPASPDESSRPPGLPGPHRPGRRPLDSPPAAQHAASAARAPRAARKPRRDPRATRVPTWKMAAAAEREGGGAARSYKDRGLPVAPPEDRTPAPRGPAREARYHRETDLVRRRPSAQTRGSRLTQTRTGTTLDSPDKAPPPRGRPAERHFRRACVVGRRGRSSASRPGLACVPRRGAPSRC